MGLVHDPREIFHESLACPSCGTQISLSIRGLDWHVRHPSDLATRLMVRSRACEQETFWVCSLDVRNRVLAEPHLAYIGSIDTALVRIAEILREPIRLGAAGILLAHSHPSGSPDPSPSDLHLTAEIIAAAKLMSIDVLDHIVLGAGQWVSLRDRGISFTR